MYADKDNAGLVSLMEMTQEEVNVLIKLAQEEINGVNWWEDTQGEDFAPEINREKILKKVIRELKRTREWL